MRKSPFSFILSFFSLSQNGGDKYVEKFTEREGRRFRDLMSREYLVIVVVIVVVVVVVVVYMKKNIRKY